MGNGLKFFAKRFDQPQPFEAPPWAMRFPRCEDFGPGRHPRLTTSIEEIGHQWKIELGGLRDTYADAEAIRDDLLRLIYGLWDHTKNHCRRDRRRAENYRLVWVGYIAGKRENRRLMGDYVLTQNDIGRQAIFPDRVAFGAWSIDDHHSAGFFQQGPVVTHSGRTSAHLYQGVPYTIPFRSLFSRNVENLLMAGRNISASHLALSNTRVMLTCATLGHAAGTAAALCVQKGTSPRGLYQQHLEELQQQLLKEGAPVLGMQNRDPRDLARRAAAHASSGRTWTSGERMAAANVINGYARAQGEHPNERTNAWAADPSARPPHWVELRWPAPVTFNVVHVTFQTAELSPRRFSLEAWRSDRWTPLCEVDCNRHRRHVLGLERTSAARLRVLLDEPAAVCEIRVYDEPQHVVESARRAHRNMRLPDRGPFLPWGDAPVAEIDPRSLPGLVYDDQELATVGHWAHSVWSDRFVGQGYLTDGNEGKGRKSLCCRPRLPSSGRYEIRLIYSAYTNRASNTPVTIRTASGDRTVRVDQRREPAVDGLFAPLGVFELDKATARVVISNDDTDGFVVVDGLQFLRK